MEKKRKTHWCLLQIKSTKKETITISVLLLLKLGVKFSYAKKVGRGRGVIK